MDTLYFLPSALSHVFELVLADALKTYKEQNCKIEIAICAFEYGGCSYNPFGDRAACKICRDTSFSAVGEFIKDIPVHFLKEVGSEEKGTFELDSDVHVKGVNSTLLTFYRDTGERFSPFSPIIRYLRKKNVSYSEQFVKKSMGLISFLKPDQVAFFNGRQVPYFSLLKTLAERNYTFRVIESHGINHRPFIAKSIMVHSYKFQKEMLRQFTDRNKLLPNNELQNKVIEFFRNRLDGKASNARSFVEHQIRGQAKFLDNLGPKRLCTVFLSSLDEQKIAGDEWSCETSENILKSIELIERKLHGKYKVVIRFHPNQLTDKTKDYAILKREIIDLKNVICILPDSRISTYELLEHSDLVVSFGSSISLEAAYIGKLTLMLAKSLWDDVKGIVVAQDLRRLEEVLLRIYDEESVDEYNCGSYSVFDVASYLIGDKEVNQYLEFKDNRFFVIGKNFSYGLARKIRSFWFYLWKGTDFVLRNRVKIR